ncbi:hypothetical protein BDF20DRAFT_900947 [Mycotypha africana]|uniref:uncharacterized protein n=1 Tax=Mycotypha africana TaxID=64632 RepID=UPI0022FFF2F3|nr:uncharacterized protein BDF20DRAFT_900947 [Mycotypha africana]KAI8967414.1 hypothetical protein BDF20DRAFT_900947 [Mycotypha africana]
MFPYPSYFSSMMFCVALLVCLLMVNKLNLCICACDIKITKVQSTDSLINQKKTTIMIKYTQLHMREFTHTGMTATLAEIIRWNFRKKPSLSISIFTCYDFDFDDSDEATSR